MKGEKIMKVTTSELNCFRSCRRKYYFEYVEQLKPIKTSEALSIGTLYHCGLESILNGVSLPDTLKRIRLAGQTAESPYDAATACAMITAWHSNSGWEKLEILDVEKQFEVPFGFANRLLGKIDAIVRNKEDGKAYILEHKTTARWGSDGAEYLNRLEMADQPVNYLCALRYLHSKGQYPHRPDGVYYDIIEKPTLKPYEMTPPEKRKYTKAGTLAYGQHDHDETYYEYETRLSGWYADKQRLHIALVMPSLRQTEIHLKHQFDIIRDMRKSVDYYPNPENCAIGGCPFACKCLIDSPQTDCLFTHKTAKNEELSTERKTNETL